MYLVGDKFCKTHLWRGTEPQKPCSSARGESCSALRRMGLEVVTESRRRCDAVGAVVCTILPMRLQPRSCLPWVPPLPAPDMLGACMVCGCVPAPSQHFIFAWCPWLQGFCCTHGALGRCSNPYQFCTLPHKPSM